MEDKFNESESDTSNVSNPFYKLLEKQATEFELFGRRLKSEVQDSYHEFINLQQQQQQKLIQENRITNDEITTDPKKNQDAKPGEVFEASKCDCSTQQELISSLKVRIEELETDSIIKNQDIEEQKSEIRQLKQELSEFKNTMELRELRLKQEIEELNKVKNKFITLFDSLEQAELVLEKFNVDTRNKIKIETDRLAEEESARTSTLSSIDDVVWNNSELQNNARVRAIDSVGNAWNRSGLSELQNNARARSLDSINDVWSSKRVSYANTSQCGAKIAVGEKYYHCRTCTNRGDTVLCERCYEGSNHSGHNVITVVNRSAGAWCDCGDSAYWKVQIICKYHSFDSRFRCGAKLAIGEKYYHCSTCTARHNSMLCRRCYEGTNHNGHTVLTKINYSDTNSWCDCGDPDYWKAGLNCKFHSMSESFQCSAKLAIGEVFYHCRTCTTRSNSILCRRCYEGTNHIGHDVSSTVSLDASNWCDCGDPVYWKADLNCKFHAMSKSSQCAAKLDVGEKYYYCRTCSARNNSILCKRCYSGTNHNGHDVSIVVSRDASNWCDCGDPDYWKVRLNCKYHSTK